MTPYDNFKNFDKPVYAFSSKNVEKSWKKYNTVDFPLTILLLHVVGRDTNQHIWKNMKYEI